MRGSRLLLLPIAAVLAAATACASSPAPGAGPSEAGPSDVRPSTLAAAPSPRSTQPTTASMTPASITPTQVATSTTPAPPRYVFPISPADAVSYGQTHHDYPASDMFAPCGSEVLAATTGTVEEVTLEDLWDATTDDPAVRGGLSVTIVGDDGVRYYASHLRDILPSVIPGLRVAAGDVVAHVGDTGNAAGTGCHVHFGLSPDCGPGDWAVRRGTLYPWPYLDSWRDGGQDSPAADIEAWLADHADLCASPPA